MFTLVILTLVVVLLFADQNLLAPNLSAIAEEFHFDGGILGGGLGMVWSHQPISLVLASVPCGSATDRQRYCLQWIPRALQERMK